MKFESKLPMFPSAPAPKVVATNTFSTGSSVMPTTTKPAAAVQTGGFGDPNGVPAKENRGGGVHNRPARSIDLPPGTGHRKRIGGSNSGGGGRAGVREGVGIGGGPG